MSDRLAALLLAVAVVFGADAWWWARDPVVRAAPGDEVPVTGLYAGGPVEGIAAPPCCAFRLVETRRDAWLGRPEWRGILTARAAGAGELHIAGAAVPVVVSADPRVGLARWTGLPSALLAVASALAGAAVGTVGFARQRRRAAALAAEGRAEVLWASGRQFGFADLPVAVGDRLWVEAEGGRAAATVTEVHAGAALAEAEAPVRAGDVVGREAPAG